MPGVFGGGDWGQGVLATARLAGVGHGGEGGLRRKTDNKTTDTLKQLFFPGGSVFLQYVSQF